MKVLISGAGGLVGAAASACLQQRGHEVRPLVRAVEGDSIWWDPATGHLNTKALEQWRPDAVLHLAGENIASRRWTDRQKNRIRDSRVAATEKLSRSLAELRPHPSIFLSASAVGFYGSRGDDQLTEQSPAGADFLAAVVQDWEGAAESLVSAGLRTAWLRFGMILSPQGGALKRMLPVFRAGLGGRFGSGKQWVSWIALTDVVQAIVWALTNSNARGPYNFVAPNPVQNQEFTRVLGAVLRRPALAVVPGFAVRLAMGEMGEALLLSSQRAIPERLRAEGYVFAYPGLEDALRGELKSKSAGKRYGA